MAISLTRLSYAPMADTVLTPTELESIRGRADRFLTELLDEWYMHYAGHKDTLEIADIYDRYPELTSLENANVLGASVDGDASVRELWHFGCAEYLANLTKKHAEQIAALEAKLEATVNGDTVGFRMLRPAMANEPDRDKRRALEQARNELTEEHMNPVYRDGMAVTLQAVKDLGAPDAVELHRRFGFKLDELADQCRAVLADTETLFEETIEPLLRERLGISLDEAERWDIPRLFRATEWDESFTADGMLPALEGTLTGLGIDLHSQSNVELDVEQREKKSPRAFCAPIQVPQRVVLVIQPIGGVDDWRALFHEAGHTEHFALTSADLSMEERRLGDNAVTEGWASLFDHLVSDPTWLDRLLSFGETKGFTAEAAAQELWFLRRYSAKLLYELELYLTDDVESMRPRYVEILGGALKVEPSPTDWLFDVDPGFYCTEYLRSWAFEAQLRFHLCSKFGYDWFTKKQAGSLLQELWSLGQKPTADEMLADVTGAGIEMAAVAERAREML
jgi:hypothetical protein